MSDFGAASFYDQTGQAAPALDRLEVRAFGCLLEDLLDRCPTSSEPVLRLRQLQHACMQPEVLARPAFEDVLDELVALVP